MAEVLQTRDRSWSETRAVAFGERILPEIMRHGFARVDMTTPLARVAMHGARAEQILSDVYRESNDFFARDDLSNFIRVQDLPYCFAGYRSPNVAKLEVGEVADLNQSFLDYPFDERGERVIPHAERIEPFRRALGGFALAGAAITRQIMAELAEKYDQAVPLEFLQASVTQVNHYSIKAAPKDAWQQPWHQDANWLTVIAADKPGLYALNPQMQPEHRYVRDFDKVNYSHEDYDQYGAPIELRTGHVLVMPGSILSAATGGQIKPLYHAPRNEYDGRNSVMYFVSPDLDQEILPFVSNEFNGGVDLRYMTAAQPETFGLGKYFVPGSADYFRTQEI